MPERIIEHLSVLVKPLSIPLSSNTPGTVISGSACRLTAGGIWGNHDLTSINCLLTAARFIKSYFPSGSSVMAVF